MAQLRAIVISLLLVGLAILGVISFGIQFAFYNDQGQSIGDDPAFTNLASSLNNTIVSGSEDTAAAQIALSNSSVTLTGVIPYVDTIQGIWKTLLGAPVAIYNFIMGVAFTKLLGSQEYRIVLTVLGIILGITIIVAVLRLITQGEGG